MNPSVNLLTRLAFLSLGATGCSLLTNLDGLTSITDAQAPPADAGPDAADTGADAAPQDPTWTFTLGAKSTFWAVAVDEKHDVYVAGALFSPLALGAFTIPTTQGKDLLVIKLDGATRKPVWAVTYGGAGDEQVYGMAYSNGALYIAGNSNSASLSFNKPSANITFPAVTSPAFASFIAKLDPLDGSAVWAASPDALRTPNTTHTSWCPSIAAHGKKLLLACLYTGAKFGAALPTPPAQGLAVFRSDDVGTTFKAGWQRAFYPAFNGPYAAFDDNDTPYVASSFLNAGPLFDADYTSKVLTATGANVNLFAMRLDDTSAAVTQAQTWSGDNGAFITTIAGLAARGGQVFLSGFFDGTGNFGTAGTATSKGAADGFLLRTNANLVPQAVLTYGGTANDLLVGAAPDANGNVYTSLGWASADATFGGKALVDAGAPNGACAFGKVTPTSATAGGASTSTNSVVQMSSVALDGSLLYGAGSYSGACTFDDGTKTTGPLEGSAFLARRPTF